MLSYSAIILIVQKKYYAFTKKKKKASEIGSARRPKNRRNILKTRIQSSTNLNIWSSKRKKKKLPLFTYLCNTQ